MSEREVMVLCYWNGCIKYGPSGVYYEGSTPKKISVRKETEFSRLVDGLYLITGFDKRRTTFDIVGRYPVVFSPHLFRYVHLPVVDDSSLKTMLEVPSIHPSINSVELYLEVKPNSDEVIKSTSCLLPLDNAGSSLKRKRTDQFREADADVDTVVPFVKLEWDNAEVKAGLGNGCTHGGGELMNTHSGLDEVVHGVNLNVPGLEVSPNACLNKGGNTGSSKLCSPSDLWVDDSGVPTLCPTATVILPPPHPPHVSRIRKENDTSARTSSKMNKTERPTKEPSKFASIMKPVNEKEKTKEPLPGDIEEDMAEVEVVEEDKDGEEEDDNNEEEEEKEERDGDEEGSVHDSQSTRAMDTEIETEPKQPLEMWFPKSEYGTPMKFITKCYVRKAVLTLESILEPDELEWFHKHPQFCHFFHMPKDKNHKMMGMWMLLLRMAKTQKCKEAWFVVNGVPVRYSMKEHALLSGLHCHEYPPNFTKFGNLMFVEKHFKTEKATYEAVEKKFVSMSRSPDRLNMAVLYFLSSVIIGNGKVGDGAPTVCEIFMRAITDLEWCKTFPWGRLSFDDTMKEIFHMNDRLNGVVQTSWCFPSFIIPLQLLAFEAIPVLMKKFREEVKGASRDCPRMCKTKFKSSSMKGFPLSEINDALGGTKDIQSIVEITMDETSLISQTMNDVSEEGDYSDVIIDGWKKCLMVEKKKIWFEELYNEDVDGRKNDKKVVAKGKQKENVAEQTLALKETMEAGFEKLGEKITKMETMVDDKLENFETRLKLVEKYFPSHASGKRKKSDTSTKESSKWKKTERLTDGQSSIKRTVKGKGKDKTKETPPSDLELRDAIADILKAVDIDTVSITDILKGLADKFGIVLTPRKSSIKLMIQEELTLIAKSNDKVMS